MLKEYEAFVLSVDKYTQLDYPLSHGFKQVLFAALGITGEGGEVADKVKKILRDKQGIVSPTDCRELLLELGDVQWYIAKMARALGSNLSEVIAMNQVKLEDRAARNKINGEGDNR
ncbi:MAG: nucleoside triphosphate pyrophosphohydrolase family protein [Desulfobacterales bacterium]|nr:nucleoside triphosphate pyrophosphohydrolase family protein [Desulfobacterales bacterium]